MNANVVPLANDDMDAERSVEVPSEVESSSCRYGLPPNSGPEVNCLKSSVEKLAMCGMILRGKRAYFGGTGGG